MKKLVLVLLAIVMSAFCSLFLSACSPSQNNNEHVHEYETKTVEANCLKGGYTEHSCSCGHSYKTDETTTTEHNFKNYECTICGYKISTSEGLYYELSKDGTYYIVSGVGSCTSEKIVIPSVHNDLPVKEIGEKAFYFPGETSRKITTVVIPDSVTTIGAQAFFCREVANLTLPDSVTDIGESAFEGCDLTQLTIPYGVINIGDDAFRSNNLENVQISNSVKSIGERAFRQNKFTDIAIPESVVNIGAGAFSVCENLIEINVDEKNQNYCSIDGNLYNKDTTEIVQYAIGKNEKSFTVPNGVATIKDSSFIACNLEILICSDSVTNIELYSIYASKDLKSVILGKNTRRIGDHAFANCVSLETIEIPQSLSYIDENAFADCNNLKSINVSEKNSTFSSLDGNVYNKDFTTLILYAKGKEDTTFTIPNSVTTIGNRAFLGCVNLTKVILPNSLLVVDEFAFFSCDNLTEIDIPDSVKHVKRDAFYGCENLSSVHMGKGILEIGAYAFDECPSLEKMTYNGTKEQWREVDKGYSWGDIQVECINN